MAGVNYQFKPLADGVSFEISAVLLDSLPKDKQAAKLSDSTNVKVKISRICGPVIKKRTIHLLFRFTAWGLITKSGRMIFG